MKSHLAHRVMGAVIGSLLLLTAVASGAAPSFVYTTLAGMPEQFGSVDGESASARFGDFLHLAVDADGTVYVPDTGNHTIRKVTPAGVVSTVAGVAAQAGTADGVAGAARFSGPTGIAIDSARNLYISDTGNHTVRKIAPDGTVSTFAGNPGVPGDTDGTGAAAGFRSPLGLAVDAAGNIFVADAGNSTIRKITSGGLVSTLAGTPQQTGLIDATGAAARFSHPGGVALDSAGVVYVADTDNLAIRTITPEGVVARLGTGFPTSGYGLIVDGDGSVLVTGGGNQSILRARSPDGTRQMIGGFPGIPGTSDGPHDVARFKRPTGIAMDAAGNLYVADRGAGTIRKGTRVKVTWPTPAPIFFGTSLPWTALNATANVEGTFSYSATPGYFFAPGDEPLFVTFVPTGGAQLLTSVSAQVTLKVLKAIPVITWPAPAAVDYGTVLSPVQLNATCNMVGSLTYEPGAGTLLERGTHTLKVTFTSVDLAHANTVTAEVSLTVRDTVLTPLLPKAQPQDPTVLTGAAASLTFSVSGSPAPAFVWQESRDGGRTWNTLINAGNYLGVESDTLRILSATATMDAYLYRCQATSGDRVLLSSTAMLTVRNSIAYTGGYFGTFARGGTWALFVGAPSRFVAYLPWRKSAIVEELTVKADGTFTVSCHEHVASGSGMNAGVLTLSGRITAPSQSLRPVTAQLVEIGENLTGGFATSGAFTAFSGDFFTASALGIEQGELYLVAGFGGELQAVVITPSLVDGARGSLTVSGSQVLATDEGRQLSISIDPNARTVKATLAEEAGKGASFTGSGATASVTGFVPKIQFAGLAQSIPSTSRSVNIATRAYCSTDNKVTIGGFVVSGSVAKRVLVRAVGPSLTAQGIGAAEVLADPMIEVHDAIHGNSIVATNDNWGDNTNAAEIDHVASAVGASALLGTDTKSSTALLNLEPGVYSFVINGKAGTSGVVLLEVYDADATTTGTTFANIATRAHATTGNGVTIGGFVITGNAPKHVLLRAVGPTLTKQGLGVAEVLADPTIELHDASNGNAIIATNDNWGEVPAEAAAITSAGARIGATPFDSTDTKSAALLVTLQPGVYSFIASGKNQSSGIVLVEVYDAD